MVKIEEMKDEVDEMLDRMRRKGGGGGGRSGLKDQNPADVDAFLSSVDKVSDLVSKLKSAETDADLAKAKTEADEFVGQIKDRSEKLKKKNNGDDEDDNDDGGYKTRVVSSNKSSLNTNRSFREGTPPHLPPGASSPAAVQQQEQQQEQQQVN